MKEEDIINQFDMIFCSKTKKENIKDMAVLMKIFNKLDDCVYIIDEEYELLRMQKIDMENKLFQIFSKDEQILYRKFEDVENQMKVQREKQMFIYGYLIAKHLDLKFNK